MVKLTKNIRAFALTLIIAALLAAAFAPSIAVKAQSTSTVRVFDTVGGTTDVTGTTTYNDGDIANITATADTADAYNFYYWIVSSPALSDAITLPLDKVSQFPAGTNFIATNPLALPIVGGSTYSVQPVFLLPSTPNVQFNAGPNPLINVPADAIVAILPAVGGTTFPLPGTYAYANASTVTLTAIAASGWVFSNWVISGNPLTGHGGYPYTLTPTNNPYTVSHGYGYSYAYQPVFVPGTSTATPTPTVTGSGSGTSSSTYTAVIIALVVILVIVLIGFAVYAMRRKK